jgi:homospermidine synthase
MALHLKHLTAVVLIGDGIMAVARPQHEALAWSRGPWLWRRSTRWMAKYPTMTRLVGAAQIVVGICWMIRKEEKQETTPPTLEASPSH